MNGREEYRKGECSRSVRSLTGDWRRDVTWGLSTNVREKNCGSKKKKTYKVPGGGRGELYPRP